jgi:hypothetical protein
MRNWDCCRAIPFLYEYLFRFCPYCVFAVYDFSVTIYEVCLLFFSTGLITVLVGEVRNNKIIFRLVFANFASAGRAPTTGC